MSTSTVTDTRTKAFTAQALDAEMGRRRNNKGRSKKVHAKSWVLAKLSQADVATLKAGGTVTVTGSKVGSVVVTLKADA